MPDDANFAATLTARAVVHPERTALIEPASHRASGRGAWRGISFEDLDSLANGYARGLARLGVERGDRALYLLRPSIDAYAVFYALLRLGAVPVLVEPRMGLRRLLACIEAARPTVVLAVPLVHAVRTVIRPPFASARVLITAGRRWFWGGTRLSDCLAEDRVVPTGSTAPDDQAIFPFTSGATGPPKGVFCSHAMLRHQATMMHGVCGWGEGMRTVMCYAPFVPYALADGLTAILPNIDFSRPAAAHPLRVIEAITDHVAACAFASPIVWLRLARFCAANGSALPTLERAVTAGAPVPARLHRDLRPLLHPRGLLYTPYGATEAMPVTTTHTGELDGLWEQTRGGYGTCVGKPLPGVEVRIVRVTDDPIQTWSDDLCVATGEIGEIVVAGAVVSPAYVGRPDETARAKIRRKGQVLHRTGDLGRLDQAGRVWFCGRTAHRIETRRGMLAPVPLENLFNEHPRVFRTALVGVGPAGDQTPVACVELEAGETFSPRLESELLALADGTPFEGVVARVLPHRGFPVDARHNSKIRAEELADWAARRLGRGAERAAGRRLG